MGRFPNEDDCQSYTFCWSKEFSLRFSCPDEEVFDSTTKRCVENWAVCASTPKCKRDGQVMAVPNNKSEYFTCKLRIDPKSPMYVVEREKCAKDLVFSEKAGVCHKVTASPRLIDEISIDLLNTKEFKCAGKGVFLDVTNETAYHDCEVVDVSTGTLQDIPRACEANKVFSMIDRECVPI